MVLALYFRPHDFPRTITHSEWKEIWRWKRIKAKELAKEAEIQLQSFLIAGNKWPPNIREAFINQMINPPILMHDKKEFGQ